MSILRFFRWAFLLSGLAALFFGETTGGFIYIGIFALMQLTLLVIYLRERYQRDMADRRDYL